MKQPLVFMHLFRPEFVHRFILVASLVFVVLMIGMVLIEAQTRFPLATPPQSTIVEVTLTPDGDGTVLRLAHRRLKPDAVGFHRAGWEHFLPLLASAVSR